MKNDEIHASNQQQLEEKKDLINRIIKPIQKDKHCCKNCKKYGASHLYAGEGICWKGEEPVDVRPWEICDEFEEGPSEIVSGNAPKGTLAIKMYGGYGCGKSFLLDWIARKLREMKDVQVSVDHDKHIMIIDVDDSQRIEREKEWCKETGQDYDEFVKRCEQEETLDGVPSSKPDFPKDVQEVINKLKEA